MKTSLGMAIVYAAFVASSTAQPPAGGEYGRPPVGPPANAMPSSLIFDVIDADGDGAITIRELRKAVPALKQLDTDKDGKITREEALGQSNGPGGAGLRAGDPATVIDHLMSGDKNGDGKLSADEMPSHLAQMLPGADSNGDGAIDRAELMAAMQNHRNPFGGHGGPGKLGGPGGGDPRQVDGQLMQYDRNGDGQLSSDEVPTQMRGMLRGSDHNGDGTLDTQELQLIRQRMNERAQGQRRLPPGVQIGPQGVSRPPQ